MSSNVVLKSGEVGRSGTGSRNVNTVVLNIVCAQVGNVELESSSQVNHWRDQPVVNTKCFTSRLVYANRSHARGTIGSKQWSATHVVVVDRHYYPAVDVPASRSCSGLEALVKTSLLAIAEVVGWSIAGPASNSAVASDVGNNEILGQSEAQWSGEGHCLSPGAHVFLGADAANEYVVSSVLLEVGEGVEWIVNLYWSSIVGSSLGSANYLEEVLLLGARYPTYCCAVVNDVVNSYSSWTWASNRIDGEGSEKARSNLTSVGSGESEAVLIGVGTTHPNEVILYAVAQHEAALKGVVARARWQSDLLNHLVSSSIENLELATAVPAVAIGVGEHILNLAHVALIATRSYEGCCCPVALAFGNDSLNANLILSSVLKCVEGDSLLGNSAK